MKAALFDVEGTLIDCAQQSIETWQRTLARFGLDVPRQKLQEQSGRDTMEMLQELLPHCPEKTRKELAKQQGELYRKEYLPSVRPFDGVPELIRQTKAGGFKVGLATTCQPDELKVYLDKLGIDSLIDGIACGTDVKHGKPHPDLFKLGLRRLCCDAPSSLTLGDSPYDANAACLAHLEPFGVETGGFSRDALREAGCRAVFRDTKDFLERCEHWLFNMR